MRKWINLAIAAFLSFSLLAGCQSSLSPEKTPTLPPLLTSTPTFPTETVPPPYWTPAIGSRFQIQLSDYPPNLDLDVEIFELDLFETTTNAIRYLHQHDKKVICYLNAGAWEAFRPDAAEFPAEAIGLPYIGWAGEKWLDVSRFELFADVISRRLDLALSKGCDGVDLDNINGYQQPTGFQISTQAQLAYNLWLSEQAHLRGLAIGMKNTGDLVPAMVDFYDFAVLEDCAFYDECANFLPFIQKGKAVFQIEYRDRFNDVTDFCTQSRANGFSTILKNRDLDSFIEFCE
jgi:hypothetical protein